MMKLKDTAVDFLKMVTSGKVDEAYEKFIDPEFKHHNQYFKEDRETLKQGMKDNADKMPGKKFSVKMAVEEGDKVMTFSHLEVKQAQLNMVVVHIMRFKNGKIIEMWDVGQQISPDSPNTNGVF